MRAPKGVSSKVAGSGSHRKWGTDWKAQVQYTVFLTPKVRLRSAALAALVRQIKVATKNVKLAVFMGGNQ
jgi:hypothetical protein